jgi:signal transduction histidine kinase
VDSVLDISQIEIGVFQNEPKQTDVCLLMEKIITELDFQMNDKQITLSRRFECGPQPIFVDPTLVRIVLQNLLVNAVKYTPRGGEISFAADIKDLLLTLTIADTGRGIPRHEVGHIFEKFYRASNARDMAFQGTGLGLYVVKRILDQIGGEISFISEIDKGTTFFVSIPIRTK